MKRHFEKKAMKRFLIAWLIGNFIGLAITQGEVCAAASVTSVSAAETPRVQVDLKGDPKKIPNELEGVGVKEHLGETLSLDAMEFIDASDGQKHKLQDYFIAGKPVLINLVYFECPMLCTLVLNGVNDGMRQINWSIGKEFNVVTVSINPNDTSAIALSKRENYLHHYLEKGHDAAAANAGWHFLTGTEDQIKKLASSLGFEYKYDTIQKEYAHPAVTFVLTPTGKISRYLYGITYQPKDLRLALLEASEGKVGNVFDRLLMFCYHYEPSARGYTLQAVRVMQAAGAATVAIMIGFLALFWTRQRKGRNT